MPTVDTLAVIKDARAELRDNLVVRERTDRRIAELRLLLRSLVRFMTDDTQRQQVLKEVEDARRKAPSLSDAVADLLRARAVKEPITSVEIREALEQSGFDLDEYSQPLGAIMTTLSRMVDGKVVARSLGKNKTVTFKWIGPIS